MIGDITISVIKLLCKITVKQDKGLTVLEIMFTLLFAPIAFPISDFDYDDCIGTGLSDAIMESLSTYATLGLTMLIWMGVTIAAMIIVHFVCKKDKEGSKKLMAIAGCVLLIMGFLYFCLAMIFIVLAFLGTLKSIATGLLTGIGGIIEALELYAAIREAKDTTEKATGQI